MAIGKINVHFAFDRDPQVYYGHEDLVHGRVVLSFHPSSPATQEFFGPLRLEVVFQGLLNAHIYTPHGTSESKFSQERVLFQTSYLLQDGPFRIGTGETKELAFTASFPRYAASAPPTSQSIAEQRREPLPPTFDCRFHHWRPRPGEARIRYEMKALLTVPGIDVDITYPTACPSLRFEQADPHPDTLGGSGQLENRFILAGRNLIPPNERAHSWRDLGRRLIVESPKFRFSVRCTAIPEHIFVGEHLVFRVEIQPDERETTTALRPPLFIEDCQIDIRSITQLSANDDKDGSKEIAEDITRLSADIALEAPLSIENGYVRTISTEPMKEMASSFTVGRIVHRHRLRIRMTLRMLDQRLSFAAERGINVYGMPLLRLVHGGDRLRDREEAEELPSYE